MSTQEATHAPQERGFMVYPAGGWRKLMFKAPITLWRLGLGSLLGQVLVLITHTGRKSGLPRRTLAEFHRLDGHKVVPVAFGARAQWFRNISADPRVTLQTADGTESCRARRIMDDAELLAAVTAIRAHNPVMFDEYLRSLQIRPAPEDLLAHKDRIYLLTFDPTGDPTPPPLPADLTWVWWVGGVLLALLWLLRPRRRDRP
ncbi:MAG: nitroreductase family deazaflavin-dependent oxidoreductase [Anaerolineae bacterium]|nr:nitroreductase family deazaflavin-dependent oxidoreductase [Anaerolineae bacterium]